MSESHPIREGQVLSGLIFNEPMRVETVRDNGNQTWVVGLVGIRSERFRKVTLTAQDLANLTILHPGFSYDGDGRLLRLGLQAYSLGIAWEFDPYFGLSISRVDPLPHQLEAVRRHICARAVEPFGKAACFYSLQNEEPSRIDFYRARLVDGLGQVIHERLFAVEITANGDPCLREPTALNNFIPADGPGELLPVVFQSEPSAWLYENALKPFLEGVRKEREAEVARIAEHVELSLTELLQRADEEIGKANEDKERGVAGADGRLAQAENRHAELLARRERRRQELQQQRSLTLQAVERITSVLILPHPERDAPEVRRLQPSIETERIAMQVVMEYERSQGRQVYDVHDKNLGYDITSLDINSGELRLIEVKGLTESIGTILLTPNERRVAEDRRDCYWLYIVNNCADQPVLQAPVKDPARFPWHEVTKVAHYWLHVDAMTKPMKVKEDTEP